MQAAAAVAAEAVMGDDSFLVEDPSLAVGGKARHTSGGTKKRKPSKGSKKTSTGLITQTVGVVVDEQVGSAGPALLRPLRWLVASYRLL